MATDPKTLKWLSCGTDAAPAGVNIPLTDARRITVAGWRDEDLMPKAPAVAPAVTPVVPVTPTPPVVTPPALAPLKVIAPTGPRPFHTPPYIVGPQTIKGAWYRGWSTNIVCDGTAPLNFEDGISSDAYADDGAGTEGQGLYVWGACAVTFRNWMFWRNGWTPDKPARRKTILAHNAYVGDKAGPALFEDCLFGDASHAGGQARSPAGTTFRRCVFAGNSVNALPVTGVVTFEDCLMLGGSYSAEPIDGKGNWGWTQNIGLSAYTTTHLVRTWIVGLAGMLLPPVTDPQVASPRSRAVGIWADAGHPHNPTGKGLVDCVDSGVACWPQMQTLELGGGKITGAAIKPGLPIIYDYHAIFQMVADRKCTAAEASATIRGDVGKLIA